MAKKEVTEVSIPKQFPDDESLNRLRSYGVYENLLEGDHYSAYMKDVGNEFSRKYKFLRYITCNFAGLVSKVIADVLFGEKVSIEDPDKNKEKQAFIDALVHENNLDTQFYESSLFNSCRGDAIFRIRIENDEIKVEDINPAMYFPKLTPNFREEPKEVELAWKEKYNKETYLIKEIHTAGQIENKVYLMKSGDDKTIVRPVGVEEFNKISGKNLDQIVKTGIDEIPIIHIPNFRATNSFWGTSDYHDLQSLFFAVNNRITKTDNTLDKHSDPILSVPEGILDENGNVEKESLGMVEIREGEGKPEYIVWDANLDSAFKELDQLVKMIFMFSEISPDVLGIDGQGTIESGRALKLRMLRTLAKKNRKALYYELGIQKVVEIASKFAKAGYKIGDISYKGDPIVPDVIFSDGVIDDKVEEVENESLLYEAGLTSQKRAIKIIEDMDDDSAEALIKEIDEEKKKKADFNSDNLFHTHTQEVNNSTQGTDNATEGSQQIQQRAK
jgi:hypothetical protein